MSGLGRLACYSDTFLPTDCTGRQSISCSKPLSMKWQIDPLLYKQILSLLPRLFATRCNAQAPVVYLLSPLEHEVGRCTAPPLGLSGCDVRISGDCAASCSTRHNTRIATPGYVVNPHLDQTAVVQLSGRAVSSAHSASPS